MVKILLGLPTNRLIKAKTVQSLLNVVYNAKEEIIPLVSTRGYNTAENRNYIASQAVKWGCTHWFMCDDDMIYEPDTINKLLECCCDIVGGLYKTKYENKEYVLESDEFNNYEPFKAKAIGGGLLLVRTDVFKKIPQPWFGYKWYKNGMVEMTNDWYFCEKAIKNNFKVWCQPNVKAKHIGLKEY